MKKTLILVVLMMVVLSCSSSDNDNTQFHTVILKVESDGYFRVRSAYTGNPDAAIDYNAERLYFQTSIDYASFGDRHINP